MGIVCRVRKIFVTAGFSLNVVDTGTTASVVVGCDVYRHSVTTHLTQLPVRFGVRPELLEIYNRSSAASRARSEFLVNHNTTAAQLRLIVAHFCSTTPLTLTQSRVQCVVTAQELLRVDDRSSAAPRTVPELLVDQNAIAAQMSLHVIHFCSAAPRRRKVCTILHLIGVTADGHCKIVRQ